LRPACLRAALARSGSDVTLLDHVEILAYFSDYEG
jgi:hypothetical protein